MLVRILDRLLSRLTPENKKFYKRFLMLAAPVVMSELLAAGVNVLDTIMITRGMGIYEVTGAALASQFYFIFVLVFWGAAGACGVFIGQYYGKGEKENIKKTVGLGLTCSLIITVIFFIPSFFFPYQVISIFSPYAPIRYFGAQFLRSLSIGFPFVAITFTRNACMRNIGQTKLPMVTTSVALTCNFILNMILIFGFNAPLAIVAFGTVIARFIEMCLQHYLIKKYKIPIHGTIKEYLRFDYAFIKEVFKVGIFIVLATSVWSIGTAVYNIAFGFIGPHAQGSVKIGTSLMQLFQIFGMALGVATQIVMTNTLGSGDQELSVRYAKKCIGTAFGVSCFMAIMLAIFAPWVVLIFGAEEHIRQYVLRLTYIYCVGLILRTVNFVQLNGVIRSGGDTKFNFYLDLVAVWFVGVPLAFLGAVVLQWEIHWVVMLVHADEILKFVAGLLRVKSLKWAKRIV